MSDARPCWDVSEERFYDTEGCPCSLETLCAREPGWAANRLRHERAEAAKVAAELTALRRVAECAKATLDVPDLAEWGARVHDLRAALAALPRKEGTPP